MKLVLRNKALEELESAYQWYESQKKGLGYEFLEVVVLSHRGSFPVSRARRSLPAAVVVHTRPV